MRRTRFSTSQADVTAVSTRVSRLVRRNKFADVEKLLIRLPSTPEYRDSEEITRAKIALAWHKKDVKTVYKLIEVKLPLITVLYEVFISATSFAACFNSSRNSCSFLRNLLISI